MRLPDAGEGVEEVRRRVAPVVQHLVEGEDVVVDAVVGEVGVFDAAKGDRSLGLGELFWRQHLHEGDQQHCHISVKKQMIFHITGSSNNLNSIMSGFCFIYYFVIIESGASHSASDSQTIAIQPK